MTVITAISAFCFLTGILLLYALFYTAPITILLVSMRRHVPPVTAKLVVALAFAAAANCVIYRMEWFDVWRHGVPGAAYLLQVHAPYTAATALMGWLFGALVARPVRHTSKKPGGGHRPATK